MSKPFSVAGDEVPRWRRGKRPEPWTHGATASRVRPVPERSRAVFSNAVILSEALMPQAREISSSIRIGSRDVGRAHPAFVIAEAGINHNGDLERACAMVRQAKLAGADAVKFQTFTASEFIADDSLTLTYTSQGSQVTESQLQLFRRHEFPKDSWRQIKACCDREDIIFLSTPQNPADLDLLLEIGVSAIKVGSDDFNNLTLIRRYARSGLPMLVSCGMADLAEVHQTLDALGTFQGYPTVLLLCTSQYPTPPADVNLRKLQTLEGAFPGLVLGFSDHTQGALASSLAVALGACVFEKHFTLDHGLPGPDHWFSEDPEELRQWVSAIRNSTRMLGDPLVRPTHAEIEMRTLARRSIVALREVKPGEMLDEANLGLRRPGDGLSGCYWDLVAGKHALRTIAAGQQIRLGDFS